MVGRTERGVGAAVCSVLCAAPACVCECVRVCVCVCVLNGRLRAAWCLYCENFGAVSVYYYICCCFTLGAAHFNRCDIRIKFRVQEMKRKTKLLFGLLLFPIVYFFFIVILGHSAPSSVGIISVSASANYRRTGRHGEAPQLNAGSELDVRRFIGSGGRVVVLMHHPKSRYFNIMAAYLMRNRRIPDGPFDPTRLVDEVRITSFPDSERLDDTAINQLAGSLEGFVVIDTSTLMQRGCDAFSTYDNEKTIYVKIDSSVVYLHEFAIFNLVQAVLSGGDSGGVIAVGNVINNQKVSGLHAALGAHDQTDGFEAIKAEEVERLESLHLDRHLQEEIPSPPFDFYDKSTQVSGAHAYLQHLYFFHHKKNSELQSKYFFDSVDARVLGYSG